MATESRDQLHQTIRATLAVAERYDHLDGQERIRAIRAEFLRASGEVRRSVRALNAAEAARLVDEMAARDLRLHRHELAAAVAVAARCHGVGSPEWVAARAALDAAYDHDAWGNGAATDEDGIDAEHDRAWAAAEREDAGR